MTQTEEKTVDTPQKTKWELTPERERRMKKLQYYNAHLQVFVGLFSALAIGGVIWAAIGFSRKK